MTMTEVYEVVSLLGGSVESGPQGVSWEGVLRVERGSGIAGRGDIWTITFPGNPDVDTIGPLRTKTELRRALRRLVIDSCQTLLAAHRAIRGLTGNLGED